MVEGTATEIRTWEQMVAQAGSSAEIDVQPDVHKNLGTFVVGKGVWR